MNKKRGRGTRSNSSCSFAGKKGQLTIFMIIGIIILFVSGAIFYITKQAVKQPLLDASEPIIAAVPQSLGPIQIYTENCLSQTARRGLDILGQQGGYIYPEVVGEYTDDPTESEGLLLEPLKVPYWHFNSAPNPSLELQFSTLQPALLEKDDAELSIESQLNRFIGEKIETCLKDYEPFKQQGFTISHFPGSVETTIGEQTVSFLLSKNVQAKQGDAKADMDQFFIKIPLRLAHFYDVAQEITHAQQEFNFLERQALDLIGTYSGVDNDKLPPTQAVTFELITPATWTEIDVKDKLTGMLTSNVPLLRYLGSTNFHRHEYDQTVLDLSDLHQKNYDNMILPLDKAIGLEVAFDYQGWKPYIDLNDKGGRIEPSTYSTNYQRLSFNSQHYYTTYDLSYPVLVRLHDPAAFNGDGYTFMFALETNIRNNEIIQPGDMVNPPVANLQKSMVCDDGKRNTQVVKSLVIDSFSGEPLADVQVGFTVPEQDDCVIGETDAFGEYAGKYPAVFGGEGSYIKQGYLSAFYPVNTYDFKKTEGIIGHAFAQLSEPVVAMHKIHTIPIKIKKKNLEKCVKDDDGTDCFGQGSFRGDPSIEYAPEMLDETHSWSFVSSPRALKDSESASITLTRVGDLDPLVLNPEFTATGFVDGDSSAPIELVPGRYHLSITVTDNSQLIIPEQERCTGGTFEAVACWDTDGCCFTLEETVLEKTVSAQTIWEGTEVEITPEDLYSAKDITFYAVGFGLENVPESQRVMEDLQVMGELTAVSVDKKKHLQPSFS